MGQIIACLNAFSSKVSQIYHRTYKSQFIFWDNHTISRKLGQFIKKKCGYVFASTCLTQKPKFRRAEAELPFFSQIDATARVHLIKSIHETFWKKINFVFTFKCRKYDSLHTYIRFSLFFFVFFFPFLIYIGQDWKLKLPHPP